MKQAEKKSYLVYRESKRGDSFLGRWPVWLGTEQSYEDEDDSERTMSAAAEKRFLSQRVDQMLQEEGWGPQGMMM